MGKIEQTKEELIQKKNEFLNDFKNYMEDVYEFDSKVNDIIWEKADCGRMTVSADFMSMVLDRQIDELLNSKVNLNVKENILNLFYFIVETVHNSQYYNQLKENGEYDKFVEEEANGIVERFLTI